MTAEHIRDWGRLKPVELRTKFKANVVRKLKLACESHKERRVKVRKYHQPS